MTSNLRRVPTLSLVERIETVVERREQSMEPVEWGIGAHKLKFEPPDIYHCHINGPLAADEARFAFGIIDKEIVPMVGNDFYFVAHVSASIMGVSVEARRYASKTRPQWRAAVIVGGNALSRSVLNMVLRTMNLMAGTSVPSRMVSTVEEAYALINGWRAGKK